MLSVIIPTLNEAARLDCLLPELLRMSPEAEIIVVDGGSSDRTPDVVRHFPAVKLVVAERGRASQMNAGAKLATGHVLLFLHADTTLPPNARPAILDALRTPGVVGGRFDIRFDNPRRTFALIAAMMNLRSRLTGISTGDQAIFVRRQVYEALGGYADIPLMEDVEFSRRLKRQGRLACLGLCAVTSARKWEREGALRTILLMWTLRFLYFVGVRPARLHRWYYGDQGDATANRGPSADAGSQRRTGAIP
jgi:rSAM/selenodomain-associated transferase 2